MWIEPAAALGWTPPCSAPRTAPAHLAAASALLGDLSFQKAKPRAGTGPRSPCHLSRECRRENLKTRPCSTGPNSLCSRRTVPFLPAISPSPEATKPPPLAAPEAPSMFTVQTRSEQHFRICRNVSQTNAELQRLSPALLLPTRPISNQTKAPWSHNFIMSCLFFLILRWEFFPFNTNS